MYTGVSEEATTVLNPIGLWRGLQLGHKFFGCSAVVRSMDPAGNLVFRTSMTCSGIRSTKAWPLASQLKAEDIASRAEVTAEQLDQLAASDELQEAIVLHQEPGARSRSAFQVSSRISGTDKSTLVEPSTAWLWLTQRERYKASLVGALEPSSLAFWRALPPARHPWSVHQLLLTMSRGWLLSDESTTMKVGLGSMWSVSGS